MTTNDVSANLLHLIEHDLCSTVRNFDDLIAKPQAGSAAARTTPTWHCRPDIDILDKIWRLTLLFFLKSRPTNGNDWPRY